MNHTLLEALGKVKVPVGWTAKGQRGVTGLETAIILIAFVVVASVFAFTVLSTGIFSSERGKETVFAGLQEARGTIEPKGSVVANGLTKDILSLGNTQWSTSTISDGNVTTTAETTDKKEGTGSAKILVGTAVTTTLIAYENLASTADLTDQTQVAFWIKSTTTTVAGQIELVLDETSGCASPESQIDVPALTANTWKLVTAAITQADGTTAVANASKDAVACVGIEIETDLSTTQDETLFVDEILAVGLVSTIILNVTNAVAGEPVDLTEPADSDDDGVADSDSVHVMVATYTDKNQLVRDLYWTKTFLGDNDGDDLLETRERVELTIYLKGLADATPLVTDLEFNVQIKPAIGAILVIKRRIPAVIDTIMNLN
jgi:flagellin FlaB